MKKTAIVLLLTLLFVSCNNQTKSPNLDPSEKEKIVKQYFEYFNNHQWKELADMYSPIADFKDPSFGKEMTIQTRRQTINKYNTLNMLFPDLHDEIVNIYPSDEKHIIVEFISTGTAADSTKFKLPICTIFTIEKGKITKDFTYFDNFDDPKSEK
ncbi:nuclear transport factor 2 family protein [Flavobacterium sp. MC2016-06]|jgi:limonene-1,2-epoxide hydrolase|uniref:nuclear transport factor 2 family protein n=1 Tax=Flavobacterium sp. MC2016-06 TaxID=2676308 RepID=UPI0012BAB34F|nr:nuclear transport factor 2 family protein [Flavobacterium sp. MC2016-06]MBU3859167.1 nuclear transport factor 2 family protein [Flavobacterium sp. MC2016-06]